MLLFSMYVDNQYTANKMAVLAKKLGIRMLSQWVKSKKKMMVACDFFKD